MPDEDEEMTEEEFDRAKENLAIFAEDLISSSIEHTEQFRRDTVRQFINTVEGLNKNVVPVEDRDVLQKLAGLTMDLALDLAKGSLAADSSIRQALDRYQMRLTDLRAEASDAS